MKNKFFKIGIVKGEEIPAEVNEMMEDLQKLPDTIAEEIHNTFKEERKDK
ncbi:hypothetical protein GXN76_00670 [Kroppenstedtia pulmonis]|uniref:Uncharacterized protein n=1 Tax=Kroppenstedtia pulmonis TaxID=1380685 RepID=A0A7D4BFY0_9BACL|nr:hypothetical protein [Kroppenstedtia pulmonis]QKG83115.1 hypothetical protein GXN76_00670 [Kroppenstedtia pulmonis]